MASYLDANEDLERRQHYICGFASLANFIASDRNRTTLIYKRFDELAARNLLYLQSELAELQTEQRKYDEEDFCVDLNTKQCARNYAEFEKQSKTGGSAQQIKRKELMHRIRRTMKDYREALLFESTMAALPVPSKSVLRAFQGTFYNTAGDNHELLPTLGGSSRNIFDDHNQLVALRVQESPDRLSRFAQENLAVARLGAGVAGIGYCRRPSAVVNLNCVTNRVAQGPRYKLSYDARTTGQYTLFLIFYTCNPRTQPCDRL
jgi:hypothetical protein